MMASDESVFNQVTKNINNIPLNFCLFAEMGRFAIAAKHHQTIAEIFEGEGADLEKAMQHYERAADFFKGEESNSSANKCMLKVRNCYI
jgi:hypothetical protein